MSILIYKSNNLNHYDYTDTNTEYKNKMHKVSSNFFKITQAHTSNAIYKLIPGCIILNNKMPVNQSRGLLDGRKLTDSTKGRS